MKSFLKIVFLGIALVVLVLINDIKHNSTQVVIMDEKRVNFCKDLKILNSYPVYFPELEYYNQESYSHVFMIPSTGNPSRQVELRQPTIKAVFQFTALTKIEQDKVCELLNRNITGFMSIWNSRHHERVYTAVISCELEINLVGTMLVDDKEIIEFIYTEPYTAASTAASTITFSELLSITSIKIDSCEMCIPQLDISMYNYITSQLYPISNDYKKIKTPFLYTLALCVSPLRHSLLYLAEWIEYNLMLGVEHFYFYDLELHEEEKSLLEFYVARGLVTVINWREMIANTYPLHQGWYYYQAAANNDCVFQFRQHSKYLLFIDPDEFIKVHTDLKDVISNFERNSRFDILVEIEFSNWFYSTQIDPSIHKELDKTFTNDYYHNISTHLISKPSHLSPYHRFQSLVPFMSFKAKKQTNQRKKFIGKSMAITETQIHKAMPYHHTLKYEMPIEEGYVMHYRELNSGRFTSRYAEIKDVEVIRKPIEGPITTFELNMPLSNFTCISLFNGC